MNHSLRETMKKLLILSLAGILTLAATACTVSSSSFSMVSKMDNTIEIKASNCDTDTTSDGSIQVGAAEILVVESSLTSGKLNIRVLADGKDKNAAADAEQEFSGNDTGELSVPGEGAYDIYCYVLEEGTSGTMKIYTKAAETTAAVKETETEAAAEETETEAAEESEADLDVADDGEEGMPALQEAAIAVDDYLVREWGELRDVTYTLDENTIYVSLWADGINNETIDDVTNWDEVTNMFDYLADGCADIMKDAGLEDGLVRLHLVSDETNDAYLPAGALTSDIADMLAYAQMQLDDPRFAPCHESLKTINASTESYLMMGIHMDEIGMAWIIDSENGFIWHNGGTGHYNSYLGFSPETGTAVVVLSNLSPNDRIPATVLGIKKLQELNRQSDAPESRM